MDEVDQLVAAWRRERPDLDTEPMQVCSRISRLAQLLDAARARAYSAQVLQVWEFDVLAVLRRAGEPYRLTPGQLINQTHVTSGTMTNRVVRLAERGLVTRTANPADGRGVLVQLTRKAAAGWTPRWPTWCSRRKRWWRRCRPRNVGRWRPSCADC